MITSPNDLPPWEIVTTGVYIGSKPQTGALVARNGFDVLVLASKEYQPPGSLFPGVEVLNIPLTDDGATPSPSDKLAARHAAKFVAKRMIEGKTVLVSCYMGLNRSAWIIGHALVDLGIPPKAAVQRIRERRQGAFQTNPHMMQDVLSRS